MKSGFPFEWQDSCYKMANPACLLDQIKLRRYGKMNDLMLKMYIKMQNVMAREEGQDLVEYALVVALIAFGAVTAMKSLSSEINTAFNTISSDLATSL
jgi:pilus assembly protein Flp/PilA